MYCAISPDDSLWFCFNYNRLKARAALMGGWVAHDNLPPGQSKWTWKQLYKKGWRIVKVEVRETKKGGNK